MSYFLYLRERLRGMSRALRNNPGPNTVRYISYSLEAIEAEIEALAMSNMDLDEDTRRLAMAKRLERIPLSDESRLFDAATREGYEP